VTLRVGYDTTVTLLARSGVTRSVLDLGAALDELEDVEVVRLAHGDRPVGTVADRLVPLQ